MWIEIGGWGGMIFMLAAFYLASHRYLNEHRYPYHLLNFFGALGVMINAWSKGVSAVAFVEIAWGLISLVGIFNVYRHLEKES